MRAMMMSRNLIEVRVVLGEATGHARKARAAVNIDNVTAVIEDEKGRAQLRLTDGSVLTCMDDFEEVRDNFIEMDGGAL